MGGEVVGDHVNLPGGVGLLHQVQEALVVGAVPGRRRTGDLVAVADAQAPVDPGLLRTPTVVDLVLDAVAVG